jgi:predicted dehydrogenase
VVVLAVPHALHVSLALEAIAAGKHVLVEKPMANTVDDCDRMIDAARAAGVVLWAGHQQRQFTAVRAAREVIASGRLGAPLLYLERRSCDYSRGGNRPAWIFDRGLAGGGIAMLVGVHTVDRASWLLDAAPVGVAGSVVTREGWDIETAVAGCLWLTGGPAVRFWLLDDRTYYHETIVECERGRVLISPTGTTVGESPVVTVDPDREYTLSFARQYEALLRTVREGTPPAVTTAEARHAVATIQALYASSAAGGARTPVG